MAMLPEYYPGLPEDPYIEYLRKLGQFQRSSREFPYMSQTNLRIENQYPGGPLPELPDDPLEVMKRNSPFPQSKRLGHQFPAAFSESPVPGTTELMNARGSLNEDADRRADAMIAEAQRRRSRPRSVQAIAPPQQAQGPAKPATNKNSFDFGIPAVPQPSAPAQGLLDTEDPADSTSWYDDPTRMGLLQAGLGLMSAPRYSTNPNDVTLSSALARGLGGFVQGYGGTQKRLSEAERQKIEDEYKRSVRDFNQRYMQTQMDATQRRLDNEDETITQKVLRQQEAEKARQAIIADILTAEPDATATRKSALNRMTLEELNAERAIYFPNAATLQQQEKEKQARERLAILTGQPAETYEGQSLDKLNAEILKQSEPKTQGNLFGDSLQAQAAQYLIDEQGANPQELAERIMEGRSTPQVLSVPVDPNDPTKGNRLMLLDRNNLAMDEIPGGTTVPAKKEINATDIRNYNDYQITLNQIDQSIGLLKDEEAVEGVGNIQGYFPGVVIPAKAKQLRALMADLTSDRLNEKFGAALTKQEFDRIKAAVPLETDSEETLQVKLNTLKDIFQNKLGLLEQQYPSSRYRPFPNINAVGLDGYNEAIGN